MAQHQLDKKNNQGFISMILVLVICSVGIFITLSIFANTHIFSDSISSFQYGQKAKALANACIEDALDKIRTDNSTSGVFQLTISNSICDYEIENISSSNITITAKGWFHGHSKEIEVIINQTDPKIIIEQWIE